MSNNDNVNAFYFQYCSTFSKIQLPPTLTEPGQSQLHSIQGVDLTYVGRGHALIVMVEFSIKWLAPNTGFVDFATYHFNPKVTTIKGYEF